MKICLVCNARSIHFQRWARYLQKRGHRVKMFSQEFESIRGVEVSKLGAPKAPFPMFKSLKKILKALFRIERAFNMRRVLRNFRPDIVHAHFLTDSGWIASWTGYHPLILTAHGSDVLVHPKHSLIDRMIVRFALHKADVVTFVAQHMKRKILELGCEPSKLVYLSNFVNTDQFYSVSRERRYRRNRIAKPLIICVRGLHPIYNVRMLIEAVPKVVDEIPDARFLIIGDGNEKEQLVNLTYQLKVNDFIMFIPYVPHEELAKYFQQADIYVSTSLSDGLSVSLLEAMASGLFPIVTDIPGNREIIKDGVNGFLIPIGNTEALSAKIIEIIRKPKLLKTTLKKNSDLIKSEYDEKHVMNEIEKLYMELIVTKRIKQPHREE